MEVQLYIYDLSKGLARQLSQQFLGTYIDAVYHTAVVVDGIEYFFGAGVQTTRAGATHHGQPMAVVKLGTTELPMEVILEYLESLKEIYTMESYDLFMHNCNNFSNDFAMFLVGTNIPEYITSLPRTVLNTPFGRMLQPQLDSAMRSITQAPVDPTPASVPQKKVIGAEHYPQHKHLNLTLPKLRSSENKFVTFDKSPPLAKIVEKLGNQGKHPAVDAIINFLEARQSAIPQDSPLPSLPDFSVWLLSAIENLPVTAQFAAYDLFRLALVDARVSAFFAEERPRATAACALAHVNELGSDAPYSLRIVALHVGCNLFASKISSGAVLSQTGSKSQLLQLALAGLLDEEHSNVRVAAASLAYNIALADCRARMDSGEDLLAEEDQVELVAAIIEALQRETESQHAVVGLTLALGFMVLCSSASGPVAELCRTLDAASIVQQKVPLSKDEAVLKEVGQELLAKGL